MKKQKNYFGFTAEHLEEYAFGSYVEDPNTALARNQISKAKAQLKANSNPLTQGLDLFGNLAMNVGSNMMSQGAGTEEKGIGKFLDNYGGDIFSGLSLLGGLSSSFATGGSVGGVPINAEGQEVFETPMGEMGEIQGPSHENGGVDLELPEDTKMYSKRLKGPDGETMAKRKIEREKKLAKLEKLSAEDPGNIILKTTLDRVRQNSEQIDKSDMETMDFVKSISTAVKKYASGGFVDGDGDIEEVFLRNPKKLPHNRDSILPSFTTGDLLGLSGDIYSTFAPMNNTLESRATDTPNINYMSEYGKRGLNTLNTAKGSLGAIKDNRLQDLQLDTNTMTSRNRNGARGINTMRALDIAGQTGANKAKRDIYNDYISQLLNLTMQEAGMQNQQDQIVMSGEGARDMRDRADKDNFYSNMAKDIATKGQGLAKIGKDLNQAKYRDTGTDLYNQLYSNFKLDKLSGEVKAVTTEQVKQDPNFFKGVSNSSTVAEIATGLAKGTYNKKGMDLYDNAGNLLDKNTLKPIGGSKKKVELESQIDPIELWNMQYKNINKRPR